MTESQEKPTTKSSFIPDYVFEAIEKEQDPKIRKEKLDSVREQLEMQSIFLQLKFEERRDERERRQDQREEQRDEREGRYVRRSFLFSTLSLVIASGAVVFGVLNFFGTHNIRIVDNAKVNVMSDGSYHQSGCECNTCLVDPKSGFASTFCNVGKVTNDSAGVKTGVCNTDSCKENTNPAKQNPETSNSSTNAKK